MNRTLRETYEQAAIHQAWEAAYRDNPLQDRLNDAMLDRILRAVALEPGASVLDAGCGVGAHTIAIARRGYDCTGVDISQSILEQTRTNIDRAGLTGRARVECRALEHLDFPNGSFALVHCRGVLMHVPDWDAALTELVRVLEPGGYLVIFEANTQAIEALCVAGLRRIRRPKSRVVETQGGTESWSEPDGRPFVVRIANITHLARRLDQLDTPVQCRWASEFWDVYRFKAGWIRNAVIRFNSVWFRLRMPARSSMGNIVIAQKRRSPA